MNLALTKVVRLKSKSECLLKVKWSESRSVMSDSLWPHGLYSPWNSPGQNTGVGSFSLLQGIFPILWLNPGLPHCRWILYQLSYKGSPRILEWVAYLFSSRSSQPKNQTGVFCITGRFFTNWATREAPLIKATYFLSTNLKEAVEDESHVEILSTYEINRTKFCKQNGAHMASEL